MTVYETIRDKMRCKFMSRFVFIFVHGVNLFYKVETGTPHRILHPCY